MPVYRRSSASDGHHNTPVRTATAAAAAALNSPESPIRQSRPYVSTRVPGAHKQRRSPPSPPTITSTPLASPARSATSSFPSTPDITADSISVVLDSAARLTLSPRTPQTPRISSRSTPTTTSPIGPTRGPRYHHSSDTPLHIRGSPAFPALPFTYSGSQQQAKAARVRFTSDTRSMPKLSSNATTTSTPSRAPLPPSFRQSSSSKQVTESTESPMLKPLQSYESSHGRRRSADLSAEAARSTSSPSWQRRVAEEMVRLTMANHPNASMTSVVSPSSRKSTMRSVDAPLPFPKSNPVDVFADPVPVSSSGKEKENGGSRRRQRQRKLQDMFANNDNEEPVQVHVVKQDESFHDPAAVASEAPWRLQMEIPTSGLGFSQSPENDVQFQFRATEKKRSTDSDSPSGQDTTSESPRRRTTRRRPRDRRPKADSHPEPIGVAGPSRSPKNLHSASTPSLRGATAPRSTPVRSATSLGNLAPPKTPPRSSPSTARSSPGDSPMPSRHRLSSYALDPSALFFAPRAQPPEGYSNSPSKKSSSDLPTSSYFTAQQSSDSRPMSLLVPGQVRLVAREDQQREEDAISLGKGKGKRLGPDEEEEVPPTPTGSFRMQPFPITQRQRLESNMTRTTDDDVLGELPINPRKRMKLSSSAMLVQSFTEAVAREEEAAQSPAAVEPPKSILSPSKPPADVSEGRDIGPSRASSRRSHSVSFAGGSVSPTSNRRRPRSYTASSPTSPRSSIPFMAIISPRPVSIVSAGPSRNGAPVYHLREPRQYRSGVTSPISPGASEGSWSQRLSTATQTSAPSTRHGQRPPLPLQGWAFFLGFLLPVFWWAAALSHVDKSTAGAVESGEDAADAVELQSRAMWRKRCRLIAVFSTLVYIPVIVLAVVFGRR